MGSMQDRIGAGWGFGGLFYCLGLLGFQLFLGFGG